MLSEYLSKRLAPSERRSTAALHRQLYQALRSAMLQGVLGAGDRLPSSRELASDLKVSRNTVVAALSQLTLEGYLSARVGSGTYVSERLPRLGPTARASARNLASPRLSQRGQRLSQQFCASQLEVQPFTPGVADFSAFPLKLWQRLQAKHWRLSSYAEMLDYSSSGGYAPLRRVLADYLRAFRSVQLEPEQIIITTGTQQSLELCAHLLAEHGDTVWIENPAYWGAVKAFMATGLHLHPVAVDDQGIAPSASDERAPPALIYLTPSHQYPTGSLMSLARRQLLLERARAHQAWILEDDYDSEFRYGGPPVSSLQGLDSEGRVLYLGTFSKVMYPGIKLGYLVVPPALVQPFRQAHYDLNRPGQLPVQAALAEFIEQGHFASTIRKMRASYGERRAALIQALQPCIALGARLGQAEQGLHLCLHLPAPTPTHGQTKAPPDDQAIARQAATLGLTLRPLSAYALTRDKPRGLVIGYGYASLAAIRQYGPIAAQLICAQLQR